MENVKCKSGSAKKKVLKIKNIILIISLVLLVAMLLFAFLPSYNAAVQAHKDGHECEWKDNRATSCAWEQNFSFFFVCLIPSAIGILVSAIFLNALVSAEICVTDKRVYGKSYFGKVVDLPLSSISAVSIQGNQTVVGSTPGGSFSFPWLENGEKVYQTISDLIHK